MKDRLQPRMTRREMIANGFTTAAMVAATLPTIDGAVKQLRQPVGGYTVTYDNGSPQFTSDPKPLGPMMQGFGISAGALFGVVPLRGILERFINPNNETDTHLTQSPLPERK